MSKPKSDAIDLSGLDPATRAQIETAIDDASTVSAVTLARFWRTAQMNAYAFELQLALAQGAGDTARAEKIIADPAYSKSQKRAAHFEGELTRQFPKYKLPPLDKTDIERQVYLNEFLSVTQLKTDSLVLSQAAQALNEETERKLALQDHTRALRYIALLKPKLEKLAKKQGGGGQT